jgi:MFS family permease
LIHSQFNVLWYVGSIIAAWTTFGTSHMESSSWSWRIPSLLQGVPALAVMGFVLLGLPESPRFLHAKGRTGEARALLVKYHCDGDVDDPLIEQEISEIEALINADKAASQMRWSALYASPANRKKMGVVIAVCLLTLWNGQGVISYYFSPILTSIGITGATQQ